MENYLTPSEQVGLGLLWARARVTRPRRRRRDLISKQRAGELNGMERLCWLDIGAEHAVSWVHRIRRKHLIGRNLFKLKVNFRMSKRVS